MFSGFDLLDVNNDGYMNIILRPFYYWSLYRIVPDVPVIFSENNKLNTIIQFNDRIGRFISYSKVEFVIKGLYVENLHP